MARKAPEPIGALIGCCRVAVKRVRHYWSGAEPVSGTQTVTAPGSYGRYYYRLSCVTASGKASTSALAEVSVVPE